MRKAFPIALLAALAAAAPAAAAPELPPVPAVAPPSALTPAPKDDPSVAAAAPADWTISNERGKTYWALVKRRAAVRARPDSGARLFGHLRPYTYYGFRDIAIILKAREGWVKVRYSGLGRRVGWVRTDALGKPRLTRTWVTINRRTQTLKAYRGKRRVLRTRVGVGAKGSPSPRGRFFIRERLVPANKRGIYGVLAFGLSAYSKYRTDWPGGGQVGIHGTNQPGLIPGRISNGCIRLRNRAVRRLDRIVGRGTPVHVR